jgi:hypothetical protein
MPKNIQQEIDNVVKILNDAADKMEKLEEHLDNIPNDQEFEAALDELGKHKESFLRVYRKSHIFPNINSWDLDELWNEEEDW